ncbi:hypothetical protein EG240_01610 [Paenimyroides tangerinum]|uniref:Uncharacterized protein n=1 Tax=Paenimyroides tangerinum TaxID=2488728 RepID=A0A3P3WCF9_9FLAO|nr:hypothetical protein [Paenimyroides tangerinum]RRJ92740.1 hypothetical protein EG240_01610 [Paenimyroides tangerinum]
MPIQNSPQYEDLTTSNDGRNVRASLQMISHFFLENSSFSQVEANSFGAISTVEFSTTAKVSFSGSKKVYAICQGQIFVQPQVGNNDKVNVILKPFKQPISGLSIKYFVYRGLNKSDFFSDVVVEGVNRLKIAGSETSGSDFAKYIWKEFNKFYSSNPSNQPPFLEEFIGFPGPGSSQQLSDFIDEYFYKIVQYDSNAEEEIPQFAYELPLIPRGTQLGNATGEIGIDVVLNNGDYFIEDDTNPFQFNLAFARSPLHKLETQTSNSDFQNRQIREMSTQFIDIASFYGLHASGNGKLYIGSSTSPVTSAGDIYSAIQNFHTKNTVFLYIQSERLRSYNFYGNYVISDTNPNNIKIGSDELNLTETTFGTSGWPVHKVNNITDKLFFALLTDGSENTSAYIENGFLISDHEDNFIRNQNILFPQIPEEDQIQEIISYTKPLALQFPIASGNTISSIVRIIYEGNQLFIKENTDDLFHQIKDVDDIFGLFKVKSFTVSRSGLELPIVSENQNQIINFPNALKTEDIGLVKSRRIFDAIAVDGQSYLQRVTYETLLDTIRQETGINLETTSTNIDSSTTGTVNYEPEVNNNFYQPELPYYFQVEEFVYEGTSIQGVTLFTADLTKPSKKILGITNSEYQYLQDLIVQENLTNSRIFFKNTLPLEDDTYLSTENIRFKSYLLLISAENPAGEPKIYSPVQNVLVYTIDGFVFFSQLYSENMTSLEPIPSTNFEMPDL